MTLMVDILKYIMTFIDTSGAIMYLNLINFNKLSSSNPLIELCGSGGYRSILPMTEVWRMKSNDRENIMNVLRGRLCNELDLLYIDHGVNDFWYLKFVLDCEIRPNVICVSYNPCIPFEKSITAPFMRKTGVGDETDYNKSSLRALCIVLPRYVLWKCTDNHFAVFVEEKVACRVPKVESHIVMHPERWNQIYKKFWVDVRPK